MKKQAKLFSEEETPILKELSLGESEEVANRIKAAVGVHCERLKVASSIRRQKPRVHDIDFVAVAKNYAEWKKTGGKLQRMKAKPGWAGGSIIKAYLPCRNVLLQVDIYRARYYF
jgi:DNA polymerase/3'-5' exonuclease PolX